jgi:hypothetical protein
MVQAEPAVANNDGTPDNGLPFYSMSMEILVAANSLFKKINTRGN